MLLHVLLYEMTLLIFKYTFYFLFLNRKNIMHTRNECNITKYEGQVSVKIIVKVQHNTISKLIFDVLALYIE